MRNVLASIIAALSVSTTLFLFLPAIVYSLNLASVDVTRHDLLEGGTVVGGGIALALFVLGCLPRIGAFIRAACQITALAVFVMVVFPNQTGELTGFDRSTPDVGWLPAVKLFVLFSLGVGLAVWRPKILQAVSLIILVFGLLASSFILISQRSSAEVAVAEKLKERDVLTALGTDENVIVIVLDGFTGYRMAEVFAERPELASGFSGFTLYPRAIASALNTPAGLSTILTGDLDVAINVSDTEQRITEALSRSFLADALGKGFEAVFLSALSRNPTQRIASCYDNQFIAEQEHFALRNHLGFWSLALARVLPPSIHKLAEHFVQRLLLKQLSAGVSDVQIYSALQWGNEAKTLGSKIAFEYLIQNLHKGTSSKKAIFIHSNISHPPYIFDESGGYMKKAGGERVSFYATQALIRLFQRLRQIELYDSALIIITSDHGGMPVKDPSMGGVLSTDHSVGHLQDRSIVAGFNTQFNPLMMIKPPYANNALQQSKMSVWLGDIAETVRQFLGVESRVSGSPVRSLMHPELNDVRELEVPLFYKPDQESYHSALINWARTDFKGRFSDCSSACSTNVIPTLRSGSNVVVSAGIDQFENAGADPGSRVDYRAVIEVDRRIAGRIRSPGIVAITGSGADLQRHTFADLDEGVHFIQAHIGGPLIAAGLHLPASGIEKLFPGAQVRHVEGELLNFVYAFQPGVTQSPSLEVSGDDLSLAINWR